MAKRFTFRWPVRSYLYTQPMLFDNALPVLASAVMLPSSFALSFADIKHSITVGA